MATQTSRGNSLEALKPLVGEWRLVATFKDMPPADIGARATFAWLPGERFLIQRWEVPTPEAPDGIAIIGSDPARAGSYLQHYFDTRGVARVYKMSFENGSGNCGATRQTSRRGLRPALHRHLQR